MTGTPHQRLSRLLEDAGVGAGMAERLADYGAGLLEANRHINLTGAHSPEDVAPHILDSLTVVPYLSASLVDIGSGGGFPAIPVAIVTGIPVTLIEATGKKATFLRHIVQELALPGVVLAIRAEEAGRDPGFRESFRCATARAVASLPAAMELTVPFLEIGGAAILQRGTVSEDEANAAADAAPMLGCALESEVPLEGERRIVIVRKVAETPRRFPRRSGVPEKRPLCL